MFALLRELTRESWLARAGAWCAIACVPCVIYMAGAQAFGYQIAVTPLVGYGILLPFGFGVLMSSSLVGIASLRSAAALSREAAPEPPGQPEAVCPMDRSLAIAIAVAGVLFAIGSLRSVAGRTSLFAWTSLADWLIAAFLANASRRLSEPRQRILALAAAAAFGFSALGWVVPEAIAWLLVAGFALWEACARPIGGRAR